MASEASWQAAPAYLPRPLTARPGSTTVEIDLVEEGGATTVRLVHHGLPPGTVADHERGWAYFLGILCDTLSTG